MIAKLLTALLFMVALSFVMTLAGCEDDLFIPETTCHLCEFKDAP